MAEAAPAEEFLPGELVVYFVRHAQSTNNVLMKTAPLEYLNNKSHDPAITEIGEKQADRTGKALAEIKELEEVRTSPMLRALQTTSVICHHTKVPSVLCPDIYEVGGCVAHKNGEKVVHRGLSPRQIRKLLPGIHIEAGLVEDEGWYSASSKEPLFIAEDRALNFVRGLLKESRSLKKTKTIAVVAHGDFLNLVFQSMTRSNAVQFLHHNCGISVATFHPDGVVLLEGFNRLGHMEKELQTGGG